MSSDSAVRISHLYKDFKLPHQKIGSVKNLFTNVFAMGNQTYEVQKALHDISLDINKGEFFGIVGRNGSGKSTLLKIIAGIYQPTKGSIQVHGKLVPFIELGVGFNPELTGRENVYLNGALLGFSRSEMDKKYERIVEFAELERFMDQKLKNYSSGMQVRLAFACATMAKAEILLVDEVLAVGDAAFQRKCFEYFKQLKAEKTTVIFVTHDMNAVREYCDRAALIDAQKIKHIGTPDVVALEYQKMFLSEQHNVTIDARALRWGTGAAKLSNVNVSVTKKEVNIEHDIEVIDMVDKLIYGIHIKAQDGNEITAMNNRMIMEPDILNPQIGEVFHVAWKMANIFNDGKYTVKLTLVDDYADTLDWHEAAAEFRVSRTERSTTAIFPPLEVSYKKKNRKKT